jgi:hypothetical protein
VRFLLDLVDEMVREDRREAARYTTFDYSDLEIEGGDLRSFRSVYFQK